MSGLCGAVRWDGGWVERDWVEGMVEAVRWRGPDGVSVHARMECQYTWMGAWVWGTWRST
jgi:asparagine synthetase B (glutamine-hydrolysing)